MLIKSTTREESEIAKADTHNGQLVQAVVDQLEGKRPVAKRNIGGEQELTNEQRAKLPYVMAQNLPCFLESYVVVCNVEPAVIGRWEIPESLRVDETTAMFYTLCKTCVYREGVRTQVAEIMVRSLLEQKGKQRNKAAAERAVQ